VLLLEKMIVFKFNYYYFLISLGYLIAFWIMRGGEILKISYSLNRREVTLFTAKPLYIQKTMLKSRKNITTQLPRSPLNSPKINYLLYKKSSTQKPRHPSYTIITLRQVHRTSLGWEISNINSNFLLQCLWKQIAP
jgi:hypothetical protein